MTKLQSLKLTLVWALTFAYFTQLLTLQSPRGLEIAVHTNPMGFGMIALVMRTILSQQK